MSSISSGKNQGNLPSLYYVYSISSHNAIILSHDRGRLQLPNCILQLVYLLALLSPAAHRRQLGFVIEQYYLYIVFVLFLNQKKRSKP